MGVVPPEPGFLEGLRELTAENGTILIFDEVMTGFRVGYNCAQGHFGVTPDFTCLGKVIGGGLPLVHTVVSVKSWKISHLRELFTKQVHCQVIHLR